MQIEDILSNVKSICATEYISHLVDWGWNEYDAALSVFAHGVALIANSQEINEVSDAEAMIMIEEIIGEKVPTFRIVKRKSF